MDPIKLNDQGLFPAIAQDAKTGAVLMLGWMTPGSLKRTLEGGDAWFYSRSREELWHKGETSGHFMHLKEAFVDCDADVVLLKVDPAGPACHTGAMSCFFTPLKVTPTEYVRADSGPGILTELFALIQERQRDLPEGSYTTKLFKEGTSRIAQKVIEEAGESALAAATGQKEPLPGELADMLYHTLVMMAAAGVTPEQVWTELRKRRK